ncbi:MAG: alpha-1,2-fucosyltransferase [Prevotella sp.]|nr:alpha-1,2-fucosyltransferase [Prevotella sp.]MBR4365072.1 alpha-1,2-fucosyltransferase [Prevotella sp.]
MKVIHIESGLGNQMLSYCEYLAMKQANPSDDCYIENVIYDIPECNQVIRQWNGYEVDRIFGINTPNVRDLFSESEWRQIVSEIRATHFWERNWNYPVCFTEVFRRHELDLVNTLGDFEAPGAAKRVAAIPSYKLTPLWAYLKYFKSKVIGSQPPEDDNSGKLFVKSDKPLYAGQLLLFYYQNSGIERIEKEIRNMFVFPPFEGNDNKNLNVLHQIQQSNSISLHIRRGDALYSSYVYYVTGYLKRSIKYLKQQVEQPVFFVFCDPDTVEWAKHNERKLGLSLKQDRVHFVDWNKGTDSWRDMQLMSECKHNVIVNSSFGWWGSWLNTNPGKITCSPELRINTNHHF